MDLGLLLKGLVVGFVVAAPAGPVAMLCLHRTIEEGRLSGIATGLGAAVADTFYGGLAALGVGFVADFVATEATPLRLGGGVLLCVLGLATLLRRPRLGPVADDHLTLLGSFASAFALTLANPFTILAFVAIFTGLGLEVLADQRLDAAALVGGVLVGALLWWMTLAVGSALFRHRFTERGLMWVTRSSGLVILGFGVAALASGVSRGLAGL